MPVLEIQGLTKSFRTRWGRNRVQAVDGVDLRVESGSVVAFVGPNGAGKTTTLLAILGFLRPDAGSIQVFGKPAGSLEARRRLGFQSEIFYTYPFHTARRALAFYGRLSGLTQAETEARREPLLERLGLLEAADRKVGTFSKGMMQRLGLAQALLHDPELLLLDEPATGLDPEGRKLVSELILQEKSRGRTIFLSSHILTDVERTSDRVVMIRKGRIVLSEDLRMLSQRGQTAAGEETWEIEILFEDASALASLASAGFAPDERGEGRALFRGPSALKRELLRLASEHSLEVGSVRKQSVTLEDLYMEHVGGTSDG